MFIPPSASSSSVPSISRSDFSTAPTPTPYNKAYPNYFDTTPQSLHKRSEGITSVYSVMKSQLEAEQSLVNANRQMIETKKRMIEAKEKNAVLLEKIKFLQEMIKNNRGDSNVDIFQKKLDELVRQL